MLLALFSFCLLAHAPDTKALSEALGHWIGKNLHELPLDFDALAKGMQDEADGKEMPIDEEACLKEIAALEEKLHIEKVEKQRLEAEQFLQENKHKAGVHVLSNGQVQYEVVREGSGAAVSSYNSPIVRIGGQDEELLSLDDTMPGLKLALEGMKENEVRKIFIHPDLGTYDALTTLEVELIRADASSDASAAYDREHLPEIPPLR